MRTDIAGQRYGRFLVIKYAETRKKKAYWLCRCDCGNERTIETACLRSGNSRSCGCLRNEVTVARNTKHGFAKKGRQHKYWRLWNSTRTRCYTPTDKSYYLYGGRGIVMCDEWQDAAAFVAWCQSQEPIPAGYSLDRRNVNGNYEPGNCRFASALTQSRNRRHPREWRWQCGQEQ